MDAVTPCASKLRVAIGRQIKRRWQVRVLTVADLAEQIEVASSKLVRIEEGRADISTELICNAYTALKASVSDLYTCIERMIDLGMMDDWV